MYPKVIKISDNETLISDPILKVKITKQLKLFYRWEILEMSCLYNEIKS